jgi:hypothetical protein
VACPLRFLFLELCPRGLSHLSRAPGLWNPRYALSGLRTWWVRRPPNAADHCLSGLPHFCISPWEVALSETAPLASPLLPPFPLTFRSDCPGLRIWSTPRGTLPPPGLGHFRRLNPIGAPPQVMPTTPRCTQNQDSWNPGALLPRSLAAVLASLVPEPGDSYTGDFALRATSPLLWTTPWNPCASTILVATLMQEWPNVIVGMHCCTTISCVTVQQWLKWCGLDNAFGISVYSKECVLNVERVFSGIIWPCSWVCGLMNQTVTKTFSQLIALNIFSWIRYCYRSFLLWESVVRTPITCTLF